jgi:hypothetical protein
MGPQINRHCEERSDEAISAMNEIASPLQGCSETSSFCHSERSEESRPRMG